MGRKQFKEECIFIIKKNGMPYRYVLKTTENKEWRYLGCFKTMEEAKQAFKNYKERQARV